MSIAAKLKNRVAGWGPSLAHADNALIKQVGLFRLIREDLGRHNLDWTTPGFRAMAVYRFGVWAKTIRFAPLRLYFLFWHALMFRYVRNNYGIELYATSKIGRWVLIGHQNGIVIHRFATIGDHCLIRQGVTFGEAGIGRDNFADGLGPVVGNGVDIGAGAVIIGNVKIGDEVRIGPNAVVMTDVPAHATVLAPTSKILVRVKPMERSEADTSAA
ncbi:MAG: serine acetyltransferase [Caulobacterales bacterium]